MSNQFVDVMSGKTNGELLEITTRLKDDYQEEAIQAAHDELGRRNLSEEELKTAELELDQIEQEVTFISEQALGIGQKILFAIFCWGVIPWAMAGTFRASGFERKYKEAWKSMYIGIACYVLLIILSFILSL